MCMSRFVLEQITSRMRSAVKRRLHLIVNPPVLSIPSQIPDLTMLFSLRNRTNLTLTYFEGRYQFGNDAVVSGQAFCSAYLTYPTDRYRTWLTGLHLIRIVVSLADISSCKPSRKTSPLLFFSLSRTISISMRRCWIWQRRKVQWNYLKY